MTDATIAENGPEATPEISVVIPTHNRPELMKLALESVLSQDVDVDGEVVIVFDACPVEVPEVTVPPRWRVRGIANTRTRGLAGARNSGVVAAAGRYVASLDDDDTWLPRKLRAQLDRFRSRPGASVVATAMLVDDGSRQHPRLAPKELLTVDDFLRSRVAAVHSSSLVFDRELLLSSIGLYDEDLPRSYGEDYDILLRAAAVAPVEVVNEPLVRVLWKGQSYYFGQWRDYATALQRLLSKHAALSDSPGRARLEAQIAFALAASDQRTEARRWARRAIAADPRQLKAYLALAISLKLVSADRIGTWARSFGRGV